MLGPDSLADLRLAARDPDDRVRAQAAWDAYNILELQTPQPRWPPASDTLIDQVETFSPRCSRVLRNSSAPARNQRWPSSRSVDSDSDQHVDCCRSEPIIGPSPMRRRTFLDLLVSGVAGYAVRPSIAVTAQPLAWHERLPKVELHLHLEGAIPKATLWELITKYGGDAAIKTREDLERALVYRDFRGFLKMWVWMIGYLREYHDYTLIGEAVARDLARQNIRYVEGSSPRPTIADRRSIHDASPKRCARD